MASEETLTPTEEPGETLTSAVGPEVHLDAEATAEGGSTPDALETRLKRLEANLAGTRKEWQKEQARAQQLEEDKRKVEQENWQYRNWMQQQQQVKPVANEPDDEAFARETYQSVIDGNPAKLAEAIRKQRDATVEAADKRWQQNFQQMAGEAQRQEALKGLMAEAGIADQSGPAFAKANRRMQELAQNPRYQAITRGDPVMLATLAAQQIQAEMSNGKATAKESAREESVDSSYTEGSRGSTPGKPATPKPKMVFSPEELRVIQYDVRRKGMSEDAAKKRYWDNMSPELKESRLRK